MNVNKFLSDGNCYFIKEENRICTLHDYIKDGRYAEAHGWSTDWNGNIKLATEEQIEELLKKRKELGISFPIPNNYSKKEIYYEIF